MPDPTRDAGSRAPSAEQRIELLQQVWELGTANHPRRILELLEALPEGELEAEPELGYHYAVALTHLGRGEEALPRLQRLAALVRRDQPLGCRILLGQSLAHLYLGRLDDAAVRAREGLAAATALSEVPLAAHAANLLGIIAATRCQWDEAVAEFSRTLIACQRIGRTAYMALAHHNLAMAYRELGLYSAADGQFDHAIAIGRVFTPARLSMFESERALLFWLRGDVELAEATARRAHAATAALGNPRQLSEALRVLAIVTKIGDRGQSRRYLEEALRLARDTSNRLLEGEVQEELALMHLEEGNPRAAEAALAEMERAYRSLGAEARVVRALNRVEGIQPMAP